MISSLTYDEVDELRRGELEEGVAELDGGRAQPRGAEGAAQRGQDGDGPQNVMLNVRKRIFNVIIMRDNVE